MRGYILEDINKAAWRDDLPEPEIGPFGAVIKPVVVAPCTTDVHLLETNAMPIIQGKAMGHEVVGVVKEIGSEVKDFKPGDRVAVSSVHPNWRSIEAQEGLAKFNDHCHYYCDDPKRGGVFAELCQVVDADMTLAKIPDSVSWEQAIMLTDMATTAFAGVEALELKYGDTVVVLGIGPVGLMAVCGCRIGGAARIIGVGSRKICQEVGTKFGVTDFVNYKNGDITEQVLAMTGGKPVDAVIVTGGSSDSIAEGLKMVKYGGIVSNVACFFADAQTVIPSEVWNYACLDKTIKTIKAKGGRAYMERLLALVEYKRFEPELMATHIFKGMDKIVDAMDLMMNRDPNCIKPIVFFE
ncbi:MAG: zinc-binding dehydrogenase [Planctomycetes bacterium]|nr:zinc-binding dehydrogenase [Planctomycetota bacterium]